MNGQQKVIVADLSEGVSTSTSSSSDAPMSVDEIEKDEKHQQQVDQEIIAGSTMNINSNNNNSPAFASSSGTAHATDNDNSLCNGGDNVKSDADKKEERLNEEQINETEVSGDSSRIVDTTVLTRSKHDTVDQIGIKSKPIAISNVEKEQQTQGSLCGGQLPQSTTNTIEASATVRGPLNVSQLESENEAAPVANRGSDNNDANIYFGIASSYKDNIDKNTVNEMQCATTTNDERMSSSSSLGDESSQERNKGCGDKSIPKMNGNDMDVQLPPQDIMTTEVTPLATQITNLCEFKAGGAESDESLSISRIKANEGNLLHSSSDTSRTTVGAKQHVKDSGREEVLQPVMDKDNDGGADSICGSIISDSNNEIVTKPTIAEHSTKGMPMERSMEPLVSIREATTSNTDFELVQPISSSSSSSGSSNIIKSGIITGQKSADLLGTVTDMRKAAADKMVESTSEQRYCDEVATTSHQSGLLHNERVKEYPIIDCLAEQNSNSGPIDGKGHQHGKTPLNEFPTKSESNLPCDQTVTKATADTSLTAEPGLINNEHVRLATTTAMQPLPVIPVVIESAATTIGSRPRPKLLANLKPKSPEPLLDDDDCGLVVDEGVYANDEDDDDEEENEPSEEPVIVAVTQPALNTNRPINLPLRVAVASTSVKKTTIGNFNNNNVANHTLVEEAVAESSHSDNSSAVYINKRSSMYIKSSDFSKKSNFVSPTGSSGPISTTPPISSFEVPTVATTPTTKMMTPEPLNKSEVMPPNWISQKPLQHQPQQQTLASDLSPLRIKPPDFSKLSKPPASSIASHQQLYHTQLRDSYPSRLEDNRSSSSTALPTSYHHQQHKPPVPVTPSNFKEISKKYNYITDLQLKPPTTTAPSASTISAAHLSHPLQRSSRSVQEYLMSSRSDFNYNSTAASAASQIVVPPAHSVHHNNADVSSSRGSGGSYKNLYVNTPEFTSQKFHTVAPIASANSGSGSYQVSTQQQQNIIENTIDSYYSKSIDKANCMARDSFKSGSLVNVPIGLKPTGLPSSSSGSREHIVQNLGTPYNTQQQQQQQYQGKDIIGSGKGYSPDPYRYLKNTVDNQAHAISKPNAPATFRSSSREEIYPLDRLQQEQQHPFLKMGSTGGVQRSSPYSKQESIVKNNYYPEQQNVASRNIVPIDASPSSSSSSGIGLSHSPNAISLKQNMDQHCTESTNQAMMSHSPMHNHVPNNWSQSRPSPAQSSTSGGSGGGGDMIAGLAACAPTNAVGIGHKSMIKSTHSATVSQPARSNLQIPSSQNQSYGRSPLSHSPATTNQYPPKGDFVDLARFPQSYATQYPSAAAPIGDLSKSYSHGRPTASSEASLGIAHKDPFHLFRATYQTIAGIAPASKEQSTVKVEPDHQHRNYRHSLGASKYDVVGPSQYERPSTQLPAKPEIPVKHHYPDYSRYPQATKAPTVQFAVQDDSSAHRPPSSSAVGVVQSTVPAVQVLVKAEQQQQQQAQPSPSPSTRPSAVVAVPTGVIKRESPLDLSVKTVKTKADSTGCDDSLLVVSSVGHPSTTTTALRESTTIPFKVNYIPNFRQHNIADPEVMPGPSYRPHHQPRTESAIYNASAQSPITGERQMYGVTNNNNNMDNIPSNNKPTIGSANSMRDVARGSAQMPDVVRPNEASINPYRKERPIVSGQRQYETPKQVAQNVPEARYLPQHNLTHSAPVIADGHGRAPHGYYPPELPPRSEPPRSNLIPSLPVANVYNPGYSDRSKGLYVKQPPMIRPSSSNYHPRDMYYDSDGRLVDRKRLPGLEMPMYQNVARSDDQSAKHMISQNMHNSQSVPNFNHNMHPQREAYPYPQQTNQHHTGDSRHLPTSYQQLYQTYPEQKPQSNNIPQSDSTVPYLPKVDTPYDRHHQSSPHNAAVFYNPPSHQPITAAEPRRDPMHSFPNLEQRNHLQNNHGINATHFQHQPPPVRHPHYPGGKPPMSDPKPANSSQMYQLTSQHLNVNAYMRDDCNSVTRPLAVPECPQHTRVIVDNTLNVSKGAVQGADRNVISKLKNTIEEKQQKSILMQNKSDEESKKSDVASLLAARIRTKGAMKEFTPVVSQEQQPPMAPVEQENCGVITIPEINPQERIDPPADLEGASAFDLMDWGSACNDFVEQLQTGKKKIKRRKSRQALNEVKLEMKSESDMPPESIVPMETIKTASQFARPTLNEKLASSSTSSDEDKPLVLIRQQSIIENKSKTTESDATSIMSLSVSACGSLSDKTARCIKEKRLEQEKRLAARLGNASSSDSDAEDVKSSKNIHRRKLIKKATQSRTVGAHSEASSQDEGAEYDAEESKKQPVRSGVKRKACAANKLDADSVVKRRKIHVSSGDEDSEPLSKSKAKIDPIENSDCDLRGKRKKQTESRFPFKRRKLAESSENDKLLEKKVKVTAAKSSLDLASESSSDSEADAKKSAKTSVTNKNKVSPKSKNSVAAKSLSDANTQNKSNNRTVPSRRNKANVGPPPHRQQQQEQVDESDNTESDEDGGDKGKVEEKTMTRSKRKQELETQKANSRVLRNDKVIGTPPVLAKRKESASPTKSKSGGISLVVGSTAGKRKDDCKRAKISEKTSKVKTSKSNKTTAVDIKAESSEAESETSASDDASNNDDSSESASEVTNTRLRPRKSNALNEKDDDQLSSAAAAAAAVVGGGSSSKGQPLPPRPPSGLKSSSSLSSSPSTPSSGGAAGRDGTVTSGTSKPLSAVNTGLVTKRCSIELAKAIPVQKPVSTHHSSTAITATVTSSSSSKKGVKNGGGAGGGKRHQQRPEVVLDNGGVVCRKKALANGDNNKFGPGWEDQVYEFKRSLKVPASLISIKSAKWHRVSTSLPDLEPRSQSEEDGDDEEEHQNKTTNDASTPTKTTTMRTPTTNTTSKINSIIDLVHQRVILPIKRFTQSRSLSGTTPKEESITTAVAIIKAEKDRVQNVSALLPTPMLVKTPRKRPQVAAGVKVLFPTTEDDAEEEVIVKNVFQSTTGTGVNKSGPKSRTRKEYQVKRNKDIIREIFGTEERPASAPPRCNGQKQKEVSKSSSNSASEEVKNSGSSVAARNEYEEIVNRKNTYEQQYEEYLKMYHPEDNNNSSSPNGVSPKNLLLAMSIDEAIQSGANVFLQQPSAQAIAQMFQPKLPATMKPRKLGRKHYSRRKGSSGFDYIRKKKKALPQPVIVSPLVNGSDNAVGDNQQPPHLQQHRSGDQTIMPKRRPIIEFIRERGEQDINKEIKGWVLNKGVGESVLHKAARLNYLDVVAYCLIRLDMLPDPKDHAGYTPLHEACTRGHLDVARLLLQHGANHSEAAPSGIRPLHEAVENGYTEIVRLLLAYGADPNLATYAGQTPLELAEDDEEMEQFLERHAYDLMCVASNKKGWRFEGPWKSYDVDKHGYDIFEGAPDQEEPVLLAAKRRRLQTQDSFLSNMVTVGGRKGDSLNLTVKKLADELNGKVPAVAVTATAMAAPHPVSAIGVKPEAKNTDPAATTSDNDGDLFEFEEAANMLPPVYRLRDEGMEKWVMLTDLLNFLKLKSKETLLKQICGGLPMPSKEEVVREFKMNDFLQKASCMQLLCMGEKLNIRASKVVLIKYTESVQALLGVHTIVMRL